MNKELIKNCVQCNKEFNYLPNKLNEQKYCSKVCRNKANNIRRIQLIRDEYESKTPIIDTFQNNKLKDVNYIINQPNRLVNNYRENDKDYYTLYLEEKHARQIEQIKKEYENLCEEVMVVAEELAEKLQEERKINKETPKEDKFLNALAGITGIGKAYLEAKNKEGKIVEM